MAQPLLRVRLLGTYTTHVVMLDSLDFCQVLIEAKQAFVTPPGCQLELYDEAAMTSQGLASSVMDQVAFEAFLRARQNCGLSGVDLWVRFPATSAPPTLPTHNVRMSVRNDHLSTQVVGSAGFRGMCGPSAPTCGWPFRQGALPVQTLQQPNVPSNRTRAAILDAVNQRRAQTPVTNNQNHIHVLPQSLRPVAQPRPTTSSVAIAVQTSVIPSTRGKHLKQPLPPLPRSPPRATVAADTGASQPTCCICLDAPAQMAMVPCGHLCLCTDAFCQSSGKSKCPICNTATNQMIRVFSS